MAWLVGRYDDLPLGTTDASVIALAERLGVSEVATLDQRHFRVVRPSHVDALTLLPVRFLIEGKKTVTLQTKVVRGTCSSATESYAVLVDGYVY